MPVRHAGTDMLDHRELAGIDVTAVGDLSEEAVKFGLRLSAGSCLDGTIDGLAPAIVGRDVVFGFERRLRASAEMALHGVISVLDRRSIVRCSIISRARVLIECGSSSRATASAS